jgi:hypothetical protein
MAPPSVYEDSGYDSDASTTSEENESSKSHQIFHEPLNVLQYRPNTGLRTELGSLRRVRGVRRFGTLNLDPNSNRIRDRDRGYITEIAELLEDHVTFPQDHFQVHRVPSEVIQNLGRGDLRRLVQLLSLCSTTFKLKTGDRTLLTGPHGDPVDFATLMILGLSLRGKQDIAAEALGLSPSTVLEKMKKYCQPPFMRLEDLGNFAHAVARSIAHTHNGRTPDEDTSPVLIKAAEIVARLLHVTSETLTQEFLEGLARCVYQMLRRDQNNPDARDQGIRMGILISGVKKYVKACRENTAKKYENVNLVVEAVFGALSATPGAPAFAATLPFIQRMINRHYGKRIKAFRELETSLSGKYFSKIDVPFARDGCVYFNGVMIRTEYNDYRLWFQKTMEWTLESGDFVPNMK